MSFDLRREPWIPWRRARGGDPDWGPPAKLLDGVGGDDPVVGIAAPRPDLEGALQEFLIGLLSAALQPADDAEWKLLAEDPPTPEELQAALDRLPPAFDLEGDGPRFFQDLSAADLASAPLTPIEEIFIDTPTLSRSLFVKRGRIACLGRPAAAMALLTLQTYAPAGGRGHRTSLRGGGPLTTLVDPRVDARGGSLAHEQPLWLKLWANVETRRQLSARSLSGVTSAIEAAFPWLAPTRTSDTKAGGRPVSAAMAHPLEAYFGLPRRIRLEFGGAGRCDLTGREDERTVTGFRMRNYGVQYADWQHPLTPHYRQKPTEPWLPVHGQPGGIGWRDWVGLTLRGPATALRQPAAAVTAFDQRGPARNRGTARLHVFGYDMDNMKARGWTEASLPLFVVDSDERRALLRDTAMQCSEATSIAAGALLTAVKAALFADPKEAPGDVGHVRPELWDATEAAFYATMAALADPALSEDEAGEEADRRRVAFQPFLRDRALEIFERWAPIAVMEPLSLRRRVAARQDLLSALDGYSKLGEQLFTQLGIPLPGGGRAARSAKKRAPLEAAT